MENRINMTLKRVVAFDIDGVLTEPEGRAEFDWWWGTGQTEVGVVSARSQESVDGFIDRLRFEPDFAKGTKLKIRTLRQLRKDKEADDYIYYGSWARDRMAAFASGWDYQTIDEVDLARV